MTKLVLLCVDGMDYRFADKLNLHMKYEAIPRIEDELCIQFGKELTPHTMLVWPSMFTGKVVYHPDIKWENVGAVRLRVRKTLQKMGVRWKRRGTKIIAHKTVCDVDKTLGIPYNKSVEISETVFGNYNHFIYQIPGLIDNFLLGGPLEWYDYEHRVWGNLSQFAEEMSQDLIALYTRQIDHLSHYKMNPVAVYRECFMYAKKLNCDVMLLADHGCDSVTGVHTMNGYIGANFPFKANSMLDVRKIIEEKKEG